MKKLNTKNPFHTGGNKSKPQKVFFVCNCDTLKAAIDLRGEINFRVKEMGYEKQDYSCVIKKKDETN